MIIFCENYEENITNSIYMTEYQCFTFKNYRSGIQQNSL